MFRTEQISFVKIAWYQNVFQFDTVLKRSRNKSPKVWVPKKNHEELRDQNLNNSYDLLRFLWSIEGKRSKKTWSILAIDLIHAPQIFRHSYDPSKETDKSLIQQGYIAKIIIFSTIQFRANAVRFDPQKMLIEEMSSTNWYS